MTLGVINKIENTIFHPHDKLKYANFLKELCMETYSSTALAHPNIALIKYWGNKNQELRIAENGSISFNLDSLFTKTQVTFLPVLTEDQLFINKEEISGVGLDRVKTFLDIVRHMAGKKIYANVMSENNFPVGTGIASSASAFAALSLAASNAIGLELSEKELSILARRGSGSACRSIPDGIVEWLPGSTNTDSYAISIAPNNYWNLVDLVAVVEVEHKKVGSTAGHQLAGTSPLQNARVVDTPRRLDLVRNAIKQRDFEALADIVEQDSNLMHAVMMTSNPPLLYWEETSITIMKAVREWRLSGIPVCYTLDAGPNVHVITILDAVDVVHEKLSAISGIKKIFQAGVGGKARLVEN